MHQSSPEKILDDPIVLNLLSFFFVSKVSTPSKAEILFFNCSNRLGSIFANILTLLYSKNSWISGVSVLNRKTITIIERENQSLVLSCCARLPPWFSHPWYIKFRDSGCYNILLGGLIYFAPRFQLQKPKDIFLEMLLRAQFFRWVSLLSGHVSIDHFTLLIHLRSISQSSWQKIVSWARTSGRSLDRVNGQDILGI